MICEWVSRPLCTLPNKSHFPDARPCLITSCEIAEALQSAAQSFKIAQMQEEGELSSELLVKTNPHDFWDCEAAFPISGLGNLARSSSRKTEGLESPLPAVAAPTH